MERKQIEVMVSLLDDPDPSVHQNVFDALVDLGAEALPHLEYLWDKSRAAEAAERIEKVMNAIRFDILKNQVIGWNEQGGGDILRMLEWVNLFHYHPDEWNKALQWIGRVRKEIWIGLSGEQVAAEQVRVLNHVLFGMYLLQGELPQNTQRFQIYFPGSAIENGRLSPVLLLLIYLYFAQGAGLSVYPVRLPGHFILTFTEGSLSRDENGKKRPGKSLFYINPFNRGSLFSFREIEHYLIRNGKEDTIAEVGICSVKAVIQGWFQEIRHAYLRAGHKQRAAQYEELIRILS